MALGNERGKKITRRSDQALKWLKLCQYLKWMKDYEIIN